MDKAREIEERGKEREEIRMRERDWVGVERVA